MNAIFGAGLAAVLGVMGLGIAADTVFERHYPEKAGFMPDVQETTTGGGPAAPAGPPDFGVLFADAAGYADLVARGERAMAQCASCHTWDAGGPNRIGPNLHDAFGRAVASHAGFEYSPAMQAHGGAWDYLALNDFLLSPAQDVRGTKMAFAGIRREEDRVAVIAYLRSISPNQVALPAPLPPPETATAETPAEGAPAEGAATPVEGAPATETPPATTPAG